MLPSDRKLIERLRRRNSLLIIVIILLVYLYIDKRRDATYAIEESSMNSYLLEEIQHECDSLRNLTCVEKPKVIQKPKIIEKPKIINKQKTIPNRDTTGVKIKIDTTKSISVPDSLKK